MKNYILLCVCCIAIIACTDDRKTIGERMYGDAPVVDYKELKQSKGMSKSEVKTKFGKPAQFLTEDYWIYVVINPDSQERAQCTVIFDNNGQGPVRAITC